jgi:hypothetical protein
VLEGTVERIDYDRGIFVLELAIAARFPPLCLSMPGHRMLMLFAAYAPVTAFDGRRVHQPR